jgi:hypothetical protein
MNFLHFDIGNCQRGEIVEVKLTSGANVRLMSSSDFSNYKNGRRHSYIGGLAKKSPVRLQVPNSGHWVTEEQPEFVAKALLDFFNPIPATQQTAP